MFKKTERGFPRPLLVLFCSVFLVAFAAFFFFSVVRQARASSLVQSVTNTKTSNQATPTSVTATLTTPAVAGHLLIAAVGARGAAAISGPSGWTSAINQSGTPSQAIYYKTAVGGETAVTATVDANPGSIGIHVYEYVGGQNALAQTASASGTGTAPSAGSVTTQESNELLFAAFTTAANGAFTNGSWSDGGDGFAEQNDFGTTGGGRTARYAGGNNLSNAVGTHQTTVVIASSTAWRGQLLRFHQPTTVTNVTSPLANGTYGAGQAIPITVTFTRAATVDTTGGTPQLLLNNGGHPAYSGGSGTTTLTFSYTAGDGSDVADLDYANAGALVLNGGTIRGPAGNDADLALPAPGAAGSLGANKNIAIHTGKPVFTVQYYQDSALTQSLGNNPRLKAGTYYLAVTADEALSGTPTVMIEAEGTANDVTGGSTTFVSGRTYRYARTIASDAAAVGVSLEEIHLTGSDAEGNLSSNAHPTNMAAAAAYTDTVAPGVPTLNPIGTDGYVNATERSAIVVSGTAEAGSLVSVSLSDGTNAKTGQVQLAPGVSEFNLSLNGTTALPAALRDGTLTPTVHATDAAGNTGTDATSPTAVQDSIAPTVTTARLSSSNGTLTLAKPGNTVTLDLAANETLRTPSVAFNGAPTAVSGAGSAWTAARTFTIADTEGPVGFSASVSDLAGNAASPVTVTTDGSSVTFDRTPPNIAEVTRVPTYVTSTSAPLTFSTDEAGTITYGGSCADTLSAPVVGNNTITFHGLTEGLHADCTIRLADPAGNLSATLNVSPFTVDTVRPTVQSVTTENPNGTYHEGDVVEIHVTFSEPVFILDSPRLQLNAGPAAAATYAGGSGGRSLEFLYPIAAGESASDLDYAATDSLSLNGGSIKDAAGNDAVLTLAAPGTDGSLGAAADIVVDTTVPDTNGPNVLGVDAGVPDGRYGVGASIPIRIQFDEPVIVNGAPQLTLAVHGGRAVPYQSGDGTSTLVFAYATQSGDDTADLDYAATDSLSLNGGSIKDAAGNDANLTLAAPGADGSLGRHGNVVIHTVPPHLTEVSPIGEYTTDQTPAYVFHTDEDGTIAYAGSCSSPSSSARAGDVTVVFNALAEGLYDDCALTMTDSVGNASAPLAVSPFTVASSLLSIQQTAPVNGSRDQARDAAVVVRFTRAMVPESFGIGDDDANRYGTPVWSDGNKTVTIPHAAWGANAEVTVTLDGEDALGQTLSAPTSWTFRTSVAHGNQSVTSPSPPYIETTRCALMRWDRVEWPLNLPLGVGWITEGPSIDNELVRYSLDRGTTWHDAFAQRIARGSYAWDLPAKATAGNELLLRLECRDSGGAVLQHDEASITLVAALAPPIETYPYAPAEERAAAPTIDEDKSLNATAFDNACAGTELIQERGQPTIYFCGRDGKRYPFPDEATYFSWYRGFKGIRVATRQAMVAIPLGNRVTHRPGGPLVKLPTSPEVYAVSKEGVLHLVPDEAAAERIYGPSWRSLTDDLSEPFFKDYVIGPPVR